jgi:hypothetical protein
MAIAFLPIDIEVALPNESALVDFCQSTKIPDITDTEVNNIEHWDKVPVMGRLDTKQWYNVSEMRHALFNRYTPGLGSCQYANGIDKLFPEIPFMLKQLPFKELSIVTMLVQKQYVPHHTDNQAYDVIIDPSEVSIDIEPRRYNILMTKHDYKSFFVSKDKDSEKLYPTITKDNPCHAICEQHHWHGADYAGPNKIMLCVFGILDRVKHKSMIEYNLEKYRNNGAIIF